LLAAHHVHLGVVVIGLAFVNGATGLYIMRFSPRVQKPDSFPA